MESILKNLILSEGQVGLQTVGCRRLALFAMQGRRKCRSALEAGATQAVVDLLRKRVKPKGVGSERGDMSAGSLGELWCLKEPELLRVAINALLNLSVEPENQKHLTRSALSIVMELLTSSELEDTSEDKQMLVQILENLSTNDENRRHLYKAELVLRTLQFQSAMHSSANGIEQSTVNDSALLPPIHGDGALTSRSDPGFKSSSASQSSPRRATAADSVKQQYVDWLNSVFDDVTLQEKDDSGGQAAKVALARMHHGEPALATPRRAKKEVSEVQRVEGGTGLLPRLIPLRSTRARKVMGTDRSSPPRGEVSYMSDDESKNGLDIISSLLGGQKPSEVRNIPSQSHDPWHPPIEKIEVRNIQKTGPPESTSQHPGSEPGEEEPCSLADVQQTLPPPLPTIKPTAKDQPRLRHFIYPGAPPPLKHTLKGVRHHDVWMGTIPFSMIDIRVAAKKKMNMDLVEFKADASQVVQSSRSWNIDQSCFRHRKELSDSRSYWDTPTVYKRGFEMDWARINSERFSSVVLPYKLERDGESRRAALDMARLRDAIDAHKEMLYSMFSYYSVSTGQRGDRLSCWSMAKFVRFVDECNLVDPNSESCRLVDLENAFIASMQMAKMQTSIAIGTSFKGDSQNYLYRFGFIGCMVRIAALKYPQERQYSLCWAFQRLVCDCLKREAPELAFIDRDIFRTAKLYSPETEDVLIKYSQSLKALYDFYGGSEDETGQRTTMRLEEWQQMLGDAEMIDSVFTRREAAFCFAFSQLFVADEVKRREMLLGIDYISFCEALARITCWKPIPTDSFLKERGASNVVDCIDTLIAQHKYGEWCTQNAPNWAVEQEDGRHLDEVFEKLLQLLVARLDVEGAGYLSAKSFRNLTRTPGASKYLQ
ncbi:hypothetical protein AB1Y20_001153 [Prymnesium parvum]|uniref:Uncharacterized protein n=1 Tax=Prymnesium parvum TaxID=97485 RepID=A0AB34K6Y0_PRYPA